MDTPSIADQAQRVALEMAAYLDEVDGSDATFPQPISTTLPPGAGMPSDYQMAIAPRAVWRRHEPDWRRACVLSRKYRHADGSFWYLQQLERFDTLAQCMVYVERVTDAICRIVVDTRDGSGTALIAHFEYRAAAYPP